MINDEIKKEYYQALLNKNSEYEGIFYVGVKTTGIFCRPTCTARKPKFENCEFFENTEEAIRALFMPCKCCKPLLYPNQTSNLIQKLIELVERDPEKKWNDRDFKELSIDPSTVRRQFKKRFGMTFVEYIRNKNIEIALDQIKTGKSIIDAQLSAGYESSSGFRDAFSKLLGRAPNNFKKHDNILKTAWIDTKLGPMIAISDNYALYLLEFIDHYNLQKKIEYLQKKTKLPIIAGRAEPINLIEKELKEYFTGTLKEFKTPIIYIGSEFQKQVWEELRKIPYGETRSYIQIAANIGKPKAYRAVANANKANRLYIIVPCHRIIKNDGDLGGYGGGVTRKKWFINYEKSNN